VGVASPRVTRASAVFELLLGVWGICRAPDKRAGEYSWIREDCLSLGRRPARVPQRTKNKYWLVFRGREATPAVLFLLQAQKKSLLLLLAIQKKGVVYA